MVRIESGASVGSGAIFETQGQTAYVITNQHVVEGAATVNVTVNDSAHYRGTVLGTDSVRDLAVVRICCGSFSKLSFGDASLLQPGDEVVAIGYALGLTGQASITRGIVSAMRYDTVYRSDVIQTDAAINPGNSGGPMLSMNGKILGINTFRIDESNSGRATEGLGFAVSGTTVQQQIPALKTARASPTPTPTHRPGPTPTPTPSPFGGGSLYAFGPASGELWHNPSDGYIKQEHADVWMSDLTVSATFTNPYSASSNDWDYGFIIRRSGRESTVRFITLAITSDGRWEVSWRQGARSENQEIADGRLSKFDNSEGGRNYVWLAAFGKRGLLYVNGDFISMLDLSAVTGAGDVAIITGAFTANEVAGAVTRFEDFVGGSLTKKYGPANGTISDNEPDRVGVHRSGVWTQDLVAEVEFTNPQGSDWDYGFIFRNPEFNRLDVIGLTDAGRWFHLTRNVGDAEYTRIANGYLPAANFRNRNRLLLHVFGDSGVFFVNGQLIAQLDLSHNQDWGGVSIASGSFNDHHGSPSFFNFNVWVP